jgi:hypothetical protein
MSIQSDLITLEQIVSKDYGFAVPIYQRLYVWGDDQVRTLLDDLWTAFEAGKPIYYLGGTLGKPIYYLGGTLVLQTGDREGAKTFDLIDGQQRFTTLWLMSLAWRQSLEPFLCRRQKHERLARITFSIRPDVDDFFASRIMGTYAELHGNSRIVDAMALLDAFRDEKAALPSWPAFTTFVYTNVQMVLTQVPDRTDLNKLFEVINNRGVQLQHHEILKAKLLSRIPDAIERSRYAHLWDACAEMGNYVEKNLRDLTKVKISDLYTKGENGEGVEDLANARQVLAALAQLQARKENEMSQSLADILATEQNVQVDGAEADADEECESDEVRSIISFPMLLQHTLRIWLHGKGLPDLPKILDKELLGLFSEHFISGSLTHEQVTGFIELLWEIRYCFDKHVIKWVTVDKEEQHLICRLRLNSSTSRGKTYFSLVRQQPTANEGFALLQSTLYHSQQITTHYWLTPLLAYLHQNHSGQGQPFDYLRHLDNHLLCTDDRRPLIERSRDFLVDPWKRNHLDCSHLTQPLGLAFPHYWFYKLEFLLWSNRQVEMTDQQRNSFRITAKNSVEHVSPQHAQSVDTNTVSDQVLDTFGNLALVSRSINSEYSNKPFNEKRQQFWNRNTNRIDSLKLALIYGNETWDDALAKDHQDEMITLITDSLNRDNGT